MTALAAFAAAALGVAGVWELLGAVPRVRVVAWLDGAVVPLRRAQREGRLPTEPERRRLVLLVCGALLAGGWIVGGVGAGLLAAVAGPVIAAGLVNHRRKAYREKLAVGAPAAARALAAVLSSGRSVRGALVELELDGPVGHELRTLRGRIEAGVPTEAALLELRARAGGRAWDTLVAAVLVQRDAGGDLPGLLRDLAAAQEAAARVDQDARAVTAQARFTARLVGGLPLGAVAIAELASPGFVAGLVANPLSLAMVVLAALLQAVAFVAVRAVTRRLAAP